MIISFRKYVSITDTGLATIVDFNFNDTKICCQLIEIR